MYQKYMKRPFDIILSLFLIIIFFPLMVLLFIIIWMKIGFPIFIQERPGLNNRIFKLFKFKTLKDLNVNKSIKKRQTNLGNLIRRTGLDELPQLFNVLINDMSLIGPRPLLKEYLLKYSDYEKKRHIVKPGITGLAQVNPDPNGLKSWRRSIKLDIYYASNISFFLDTKILFKTFIITLSGAKQHEDFRKFYE